MGCTALRMDCVWIALKGATTRFEKYWCGFRVNITYSYSDKVKLLDEQLRAFEKAKIHCERNAKGKLFHRHRYSITGNVFK